jgi:hypothetical protein
VADCAAVAAFRAHVDEAVERLLAGGGTAQPVVLSSTSASITSSRPGTILTDIPHAAQKSAGAGL